jgi:hypothetical protein
MDRNTIENILNFLKEKEGKKIPEHWFDSIEKLKLIEKLKNHPDGIQYKHMGALDLDRTNIRELPKYLYVTSYLSLNYCNQITKLPDNLYVGHNLFLIETSIEELPDNLYVGRKLFIGNTPLSRKYTDEQIYEMITLRGGRINGKIIR